MIDLWDNILVKPPFAADPPYKFDIAAKTVGMVAMILGGIAIFTGLTGLIGLFSICSTRFYFNTTCGFPVLSALAILITMAGEGLGIYGGSKMYHGDKHGRALLVYAVAIVIIAGLFKDLGLTAYEAFAFVDFLFLLVIGAAVYYAVIIARFPGDPALVASPRAVPPGYGAVPPVYQPQPPPQAAPPMPQQLPPASPPPPPAPMFPGYPPADPAPPPPPVGPSGPPPPV